jgi:hypothetical protein
MILVLSRVESGISARIIGPGIESLWSYFFDLIAAPNMQQTYNPTFDEGWKMAPL